jgi:enoyl-CoA hydratase
VGEATDAGAAGGPGEAKEDRATDGVAANEAGEPVVQVEVDEAGVARITLNRPEKMNALNEDVRQGLMTVLDRLALDDAVKVAVLHGAGDRAFVAGADVTEFAGRTPEEQRRVYRRRRVYDALADFPKPVVCAVHGHCLGGGSELALACDVRVADRTARFAQAEIRLGIIPGAGGTQRLARLVGHGQAARIALTGDAIDAEEAHRIGLVEVLVDEGAHLEAALRLAGRMARWSPVALRLVKQSLGQALETPLSAGLELEKELFLAAFASDEARAGLTAFVEKRRARVEDT